MAHPSDEPARDDCTVALRLVTTDDAHDTSEEAPRTELSLVLICRDAGRTIAAIGVERGICRLEEAPPTALLRASCWWPDASPRGFLVEREGARVLVRADDARGGAPPRGSLELPEGARIDVLDGASSGEF